MKMPRIAALAGSLLLAASAAQAVELSVTPIYWTPDLDASAKIEKNGIGTEVDFVDDLGMDDEDIPGVTVDLLLGRSNHFLFSYWSVGYDGRNTLTRSFDFNGRSYAVGSTVTSSLDLDTYELGYAWDVLNFGTFRLGPTLNVNYYQVAASLRSDLIPTVNDEKFDLVFPMAGIRFGMDLLDGKVGVGARFSGLFWQGSGFWDGAAELSFRPLKNVAVAGGYRMIHLDVSDDDDSADLELGGLTLSATVRF